MISCLQIEIVASPDKNDWTVPLMFRWPASPHGWAQDLARRARLSQGDAMLKVHDKKLGATAVLCLEGRIVRGETAPLDSAVSAQSDVSTVVLDLTHVSAVDAGGLGMLVHLREQTQARGVDLKLMNVSTLVSRVLEISRLNSVF